LIESKWLSHSLFKWHFMYYWKIISLSTTNSLRTINIRASFEY